MEKPISLDGVTMRVVATAETGEVNLETLFEFIQQASVVSAREAGGQVRLGFLVGTLRDQELRFRYSQVDNSGRLDGGSSTCEIKRLVDGRIQLIGHFKWDSREGSGTNIFAEVDASANNQ